MHASDNKITKVCEFCGKNFLASYTGRKFCSRKCLTAHQRRLYKKYEPEVRICLHCKKHVQVNQVNPKHLRLFCNTRCRVLFERDAVKRALQELGGDNLFVPENTG